MIRTLDELKKLFIGCDAWLVGGGARYVLGREGFPKDWDVVITHGSQSPVIGSLPHEETYFGGKRIPSLGLDYWFDDIGDFLRQVPRGKDGLAYHLETGATLFTHEYVQGIEVVTRPDLRFSKNKYPNGRVE